VAALRRIALLLAAVGAAGLLVVLALWLAPRGADLPQVAAYAETPVALLALGVLAGAVVLVVGAVLWCTRRLTTPARAGITRTRKTRSRHRSGR